MRQRRGQTAIEFLVLAGFMLLVFTVFSFIIEERSAISREQSRHGELVIVAETLEGEVLNAYRVHDGYLRVFELPQSINGESYSMSIIDRSEVTLRMAEDEYLLFLPTNVSLLDSSGNPTTVLRPGNNLISKVNGNISMQPAVTEIVTCYVSGGMSNAVTCTNSLGSQCTTGPGGMTCQVLLTGRAQRVIWTTSCGSDTRETVLDGEPETVSFSC